MDPNVKKQMTRHFDEDLAYIGRNSKCLADTDPDGILGLQEGIEEVILRQYLRATQGLKDYKEEISKLEFGEISAPLRENLPEEIKVHFSNAATLLISHSTLGKSDSEKLKIELSGRIQERWGEKYGMQLKI